MLRVLARSRIQCIKRGVGETLPVVFEKGLSTSLESAPASRVWRRNALRRHVEEGTSTEKRSLASQELQTILHQVGDVLDRSNAVSDKALAMSVVDRHVYLPAQSHSLSPEILTLGLQVLGRLGESDKAIDLYYEQKMKGAVDAQHLTSLFRVLRMAVERKVSNHKNSWNNQSFKYRDSKQAVDHANEKDAEIFSLLAQALDVYKDATTDSRGGEAASSHIVANSILGVLMAAPKSVMSANPELLEEALAVMLNLHRTEEGLAERASSSSSEVANDQYTLPVEPHRGIYGQLISLAGRAGMLSIALSLHENMTQEAELYPTIFTETCLLTALGDCGEYEMAHNLYESMVTVSQDAEDGPAFGPLGVRAVTKYMEICLASGDVGSGLLAFKNWRKVASERPTWYCLQVLHSLAKHDRHVNRGKRGRKATIAISNSESDSAAPAAANNNNNDSDSDRDRNRGVEKASSWNPPGQWSDQRVTKEQGEALKVVTGAVKEGLLKPYLYGEVPLSLLASEVGAYLITTGHLDLIAEKRLPRATKPQVARCWVTLAHLLRVRGCWRDLLSLHTRLVHGHSDLDTGTKLTLFGSTVGALNAMSKGDINISTNKGGVVQGVGAAMGQRAQWTWDSHFNTLLDECLAEDAKVEHAHERFRFQRLFYALRGEVGDGSGLVPFALEQILLRAASFTEKEGREPGEVLHPRILTDALFNCTEATEISLCLEAYSAVIADLGGKGASRKTAVLNAINEVGIPKAELLMQIDKLFEK